MNPGTVVENRRIRRRAPRARRRPWVVVNMAITADGKIATANRAVTRFTGARDQRHLLELRAGADAVMCGARTVEEGAVDMGPGGLRYRRLRLRRGLSEFNLRVIVSGAGTVDPRARVFRRRCSPVIVLTTRRASPARRRRLGRVADAVKVCGERRVDFGAAL
ncbi:MAG: dihydrofolate reductase family protein, partial [Verrucomicrobia bacterium]|nr:dihydrofolate reductase family protein [Verrucomicrobiota bacterium]